VKEIAVFKDSHAFVLHEGDMATDEKRGHIRQNFAHLTSSSSRQRGFVLDRPEKKTMCTRIPPL
jgi:hypothetical protein